MFPSAVSGANIIRARGSGYWSRTFCAICPNEVIFRAQIAEDLTDAPFIEFAYDNVDIGTSSVPLPGLVCYLSPTTNIRDAIYRGRVRLNPTSDTFYIDQNASTVTDGMYIIVCADSDWFARVRVGDLEDGSITFHNLEPQISGLPGVVILYDSDNDGVVSFSPTQSGIAVADGTTISSWNWTIRGGGTTSFTSGNASSQNPVIQFAAGFMYMVRCTVTDSGGVSHYQWIHLYAISRTFTSPIGLSVATGNFNSEVTTGFIASITAYADVSTLVDRSHVAVFKVERFSDNTATPILTNLRYSGRLRSETISTSGDSEAGQIQEVTFAAEGLTSYMQRLKVPNDIVRANPAPDEFGEITDPTIYRMLVYFFSLYTTILNQGSFTAGDNDMLAWQYGGAPVSVDGGYALDTMNELLDRIKAGANYSPDGSIHIEQLASYKVDRSGIETVMGFALTDMRDYVIDRDSSKQTAQVIGYGGSFDSTIDDFILYTAQAPSIVYSDAPEVAEITRELLEVDASTSEATTELAARTGNHYAYNNAKPLLRLLLRDTWNWLFATSYQRYTADIPASSNVRGIEYTDEDFWQLQSVNVTVNADGTDDVTAELVAETEFTDAQSIASQLPDNLSNLNPVLPILSDDPAFPDDPLWQFPTDTPSLDEIQPIDPYSGYQGYSPFSPDGAADAARKQGTAFCKVFQVSARNPGITTSPFLTTSLTAYVIKVSGSAIISSGYIHSSNFVASEDGWESYPGGGGLDGGVYTPGSGWGGAPTQPGRGHIVYNFSSPAFITSISVTRSAILTGNLKDIEVGQWDGATITDDHHETQDSLTEVFTIEDTWDGIFVGQFQSIDNTVPLNGYITNVTVRGTGVNPFSGEPADDITGDWFYQIQNDVAQLWGTTEGGLLDGNKPAVIPDYNASHVYSFPFTGTGNAIQAAYALSSYTGVQSTLFTIEVCLVNP